MIQVRKRDGKKMVSFQLSKIEAAILKCLNATSTTSSDNQTKAKLFAKNVFCLIVSRKLKKSAYYEMSDECLKTLVKSADFILDIEEIQDTVVQVLASAGEYHAVIGYCEYRYKHYLEREQKYQKKYKEKLMASNVVNQNANVDERSAGGRSGEAGDVYERRYALEHIVSAMARKNHEDNYIYIHDLNKYSVGLHNCLSMPFDDLLSKGFYTRQGNVRPASSLNTAFQLIAVIFQLQSLDQFGGVSATHIDWTMVPYFRKSFMKHYMVAWVKETPGFIDVDIAEMMSEVYYDNIGITRSALDDWLEGHKYCFFEATGLKEQDFTLDNKKKLNNKFYQSALFDTIIELRQAVEGLLHNLNTLQSRSGNQLPFTSINYGTCTEEEGRLIIRALLLGCLNGIGFHHDTAIFPCQIFQYMKGVNAEPGTPNYDLKQLAIRSTANRMYPNYANVDWSGNVGYDVNDPKTYFSTMGCRTANGFDINGFGQLKDGRGNICPVTIIMPTLAMEKKLALKDGENLVESFMQYFDQKINEAKDMLLERFNWICSQSPDSAPFMWRNNTMAGYVPEEGIRSALKHGTLAIGQIGLAETLQILIGKNHTTPEGLELAKRIESLIRKRCDEFKQQYKLNFGVYYTPAENLCYTAMVKFQNRFGKIKGISDHDYFTNSMHVPVWENVDVFQKIDIESQLTGYSNAGCITYVELPSTAKHNLEAVEQIVDYAMKSDIPYFAINTPLDTCRDCGYASEINDTCPMCGSNQINHLRRVTGYLSVDYSNFNPGKQKEVQDRVKHVKNL